MAKAFPVVGLAFCLSVAATTCMAALQLAAVNVGPQRVTGTQNWQPAGGLTRQRGAGVHADFK